VKKSSEKSSRLSALKILPAPAKREFDAISRLGTQMLDVPIALIVMIDGRRQWFKSRRGSKIKETPDEVTFCCHIMAHNKIFEIPDLKRDKRFKDNRLVCGAPKIRFCAGVPLRTMGDRYVGTFCVMDSRPRRLTKNHKEILLSLGREVMSRFDLIRQNRIKARSVENQKKAEDELVRTHQRYETLVRNMSEGLLQVNQQDEIEFVNDRFCELTGYTRDELMGRRGYEILVTSEEDRKTLLEKNRMRSEGFSDRYEMQIRKKSGKLIWVLVGGAPLVDADGNSIGSIGVLTDISDSHRIQEVLKESEERYRIVSQLTSDFVYKDRITKDGSEIEWCSDAFENVMGYTFEEYNRLGGWKKLYHSDDLIQGEATHRELLEGRETLGVRRICQPDGSYRWVQFHNHPVLDNEGRVCAFIGAAKDLTKQKLAEDALKESERRYRELVDQGLGLICTHDLDGILLSINPAAAYALGYSESEMVGKSLIEFLAHPVRAGFIKYQSFIQSNGVASGVMYLLTKGGEERVWSYHNILQHTESRTYVLGHAHDITERVLVEKEREKLIAELREALTKVKILSGFLPICSSCKKIRDDQGYWHQIESYISSHSEAEFSHGLCVDCMEKLYPGIHNDM